jgi:hypothetical protein
MSIKTLNHSATKQFVVKATPAVLTKAELLTWIDAVLGTAQTDQGWRLFLVLVEWEPNAWRLAYTVPSYAGAWEPGGTPTQWIVLGWLKAAPGPSEPSCWPSLDGAAAEALAIRQAGLTMAARQGRGNELQVVVSDRPQVVVV